MARHQQPQQGGFSAAGRTNNRIAFSCLKMGGNIVQDVGTLLVAKRDIPQTDSIGQSLGQKCTFITNMIV